MLSVGGMNAGMMNMNRNDARVFTRNDAAPKETLPLASDYFTKMRLSAHSAHEYELIALALMENALERSRKERIYGGADESWRDIGATHGFKRFTKMEGKAQHYRVQGVVRAPLSNVMDMLYAERNASIPLRRNAFYGNGMDGQTLHVLRPRTDNDRHQHLTLRWEAFNIQTATDNFKFDSSHIEYTGVSLDQDRQPVGFKITHSVELPQVKSLLKSHGLHRLEGTEIITLRGTSNNAYTDLTLEGSIEVDDRLPTSALSAYLTQISQQLSRLPMEIQSRRLGAMKIMDKSMWVPANERKNCSVCLSRFGVLGKKHHCRTCGEVICKPCIVTRPNNEEMKFCKKCVVVACADQELVIPDRNPISTPSSHSSSSSSRHREARDSYASSLSRQSDERLSASVFMPQQQMKQPTKTVSQSNSRGYDYRYADDLKHHREDNHSINSMTASETSFGSSTFSSTGFAESTTPQFDSGYYERPEGSMIYLDTRQMKRGTPEDYTPVPTYNSGRGYTVRQPAPVSEEFSPYSSGIGFSGRQPASMQDVESSLAQQRHILQEMMHQANRSYRSNAPVKVKY